MSQYSGIGIKDALDMVGEGWGNLVRRAYEKLPEGTNVLQVKEKFGGLRIYVSSAPREYHNLLEELCDESIRICEVCGKDGHIDTWHGWYRALCDEDAEKLHKEFP